MGRTSEDHNTTRTAEANAEGQANDAFNKGGADIGQFNQNENTLAKGGQVAADPWKSAGYLSNVNRLQSEALNSEDSAGKNEIQQVNHRTGGLNSGATLGATKDLSLSKMRLGDVLSAERSSGDFGKNVNYQQGMAEAPLRAASAESGFYGPAMSGVGSTNSDLTKYGLQQQAYLYSLYDKGMQAAASAASAGMGGGA